MHIFKKVTNTGSGLLVETPIGDSESIDDLHAAASLLPGILDLLAAASGEAVAAIDLLGEDQSGDVVPILDEGISAGISAIMMILEISRLAIIRNSIESFEAVAHVRIEDLENSPGLSLGLLFPLLEDLVNLGDFFVVQETKEILFHLGPEQRLIGSAITPLLMIGLVKVASGDGQDVDDDVDKVKLA